MPSLLHEQLKEVALEAWDRITPQGEPKGSYTKIFQKFPTSPAPSAPHPPLATGTKPKVPSIQEKEQDDPDDDSSEVLFDSKADNTFLYDNDKPLACTHIYETILSTHSPS